MQNKSYLRNLLLALCPLLPLSAMADNVKLAEWNMESTDDVAATWFTVDGAPSIAPDESIDNAENYLLTAQSTGRYWQLCTGYQNKVLRIDCTKQESRTEPLNMEFAEKYVDAGDYITQVELDGGLITFTYRDKLGGEKFTFYVVTYKSDEAFWLDLLCSQ